MFRVVQSLDELVKAFIVRGIVFIEEQRTNYSTEIDEYDHASVHIIGDTFMEANIEHCLMLKAD